MKIRTGPERVCAELPVPSSCSLVVLGGGGDLARRKLLPAVAALRKRGLLPRTFRFIGVGRRAGPEGYDEYVQADVSAPEVAERLKALPNAVLYAALPPSAVPAAAALAAGCQARRLVVEKPFGVDLASSRKLDRELRRSVSADRLFRIDHYLGKDAALNIMTTRFDNLLFEAAWDRRSIERVDIEVLEAEGVEGRERFYDPIGVVRDMVQNHMLQLLALTAMERPGKGPDAARRAKAAVLARVQPARSALLGQYEGYPVKGSRTPTYADLTLAVDSPRWRGVPFRLRTGKALAERRAAVTVTLKDGRPVVFELQPRGGLSFALTVKSPGPRFCVVDASVDLRYDDPPDAYERLLLDALRGEHELFIRQDAVEEGWRIVAPLLKAGKLAPYARGSNGPLR